MIWISANMEENLEVLGVRNSVLVNENLLFEGVARVAGFHSLLLTEFLAPMYFCSTESEQKSISSIFY